VTGEKAAPNGSRSGVLFVRENAKIKNRGEIVISPRSD
jgi:hypothetical protein